MNTVKGEERGGGVGRRHGGYLLGMFSRVTTVTIDCADPDRLAEFWCAVLGYHVADRGHSLDGTVYVQIQGDGPPLLFEQVPERARHQGKNPVHLDLDPPGAPSAEVERLLGLGARRSELGRDPRLPWVVLLDPEDNEFCLLDREREAQVQA